MTSLRAPTTEPRDFVARRGLVAACIALAIGALALAVMAWAFQAEPARAYHSYLTAYVFVLSVLLGALGFTLIAHAANTTWPVALRRLSEASVAVLPLFLLLFVPVVLGLARLYPWARTAPVPEPLASVLAHRRVFMNPRFFTIRACVFLGLWSFIALWLRRSSLAMDAGKSGVERSLALRRSSYAGLVVTALTVAFAGFDWLMSLSPEFASTMFGAYFIAMCLFGGCAWLVLLVAFAEARGFSGPLDESHYHALGRLLLTFLIFVGYLAFFQYMLCWIANKPDEVAFYLARSRGTYGWESLFLVLGHMFLPFLALLSFRLKRRARELAVVGAWCLASHYVHLHWLITAESERRGFDWLDAVALVAVAGLTVGTAILLQHGKSTVAHRDPRYAAALAYRSR
jgi:hypothetical protein